VRHIKTKDHLTGGLFLFKQRGFYREILLMASITFVLYTFSGPAFIRTGSAAKDRKITAHIDVVVTLAKATPDE